MNLGEHRSYRRDRGGRFNSTGRIGKVCRRLTAKQHQGLFGCGHFSRSSIRRRPSRRTAEVKPGWENASKEVCDTPFGSIWKNWTNRNPDGIFSRLLQCSNDLRGSKARHRQSGSLNESAWTNGTILPVPRVVKLWAAVRMCRPSGSRETGPGEVWASEPSRGRQTSIMRLPPRSIRSGQPSSPRARPGRSWNDRRRRSADRPPKIRSVQMLANAVEGAVSERRMDDDQSAFEPAPIGDPVQ